MLGQVPDAAEPPPALPARPGSGRCVPAAGRGGNARRVPAGFPASATKTLPSVAPTSGPLSEVSSATRPWRVRVDVPVLSPRLSRRCAQGTAGARRASFSLSGSLGSWNVLAQLRLLRCAGQTQLTHGVGGRASSVRWLPADDPGRSPGLGRWAFPSAAARCSAEAGTDSHLRAQRRLASLCIYCIAVSSCPFSLF